MPEIRTRDYARRTVRALDRAGILTARMKQSLIRSRADRTDERIYAVEKAEHGAEMLPRALLYGRKKKKRQARVMPPEIDGRLFQSNVKQGAYPDEEQIGAVQFGRKRSSGTAGNSVLKGRFISKTRQDTARLTKRAATVLRKVLRRILEALKSLITAIASGGGAAIAAVIVICFIGIIIASPYGIFLSGDSEGETIPDVVRELSEDYYKAIEEIKESVDFDDIEIVSNDGVYSLRWDEILSVFSVLLTTDENSPVEVVTVDQAKKDLLKTLLQEMNDVSYSVETETYEEIEIVEDEEGHEREEAVEKTKTTLILRLTHRSAEGQAAIYAFTEKQMSFLKDLLSGKYATLWAQLLGGWSGGIGIIPSDATWVGIGRYSWPLPVNGVISSGYGWRTDPFTGERKFHGGIDIAVAAGTPIIAADGGTVTVANGVDSWGGGYGFYMMINHGDGDETLYAHCSSICVRYGQTVHKGEVIAYVGSTGNSTGNHLHFEIRINGAKQNPMAYFKPVV